MEGLIRLIILAPPPTTPNDNQAGPPASASPSPRNDSLSIGPSGFYLTGGSDVRVENNTFNGKYVIDAKHPIDFQVNGNTFNTMDHPPQNNITTVGQSGGNNIIATGSAVVTVNPTPRKGLRQLGEAEYNPSTGQTIFKFGSDAGESQPAFSVTLPFVKPYESVIATIVPDNPKLSLNPGLNDSPAWHKDKTIYTTGAPAGISQAKLVLIFTAPYKMELKSDPIIKTFPNN